MLSKSFRSIFWSQLLKSQIESLIQSNHFNIKTDELHPHHSAYTDESALTTSHMYWLTLWLMCEQHCWLLRPLGPALSWQSAVITDSQFCPESPTVSLSWTAVIYYCTVYAAKTSNLHLRCGEDCVLYYKSQDPVCDVRVSQRQCRPWMC